jgi:predicted RNA-binding protein
VCLATVYVERDGDREEVMHDVARVKPDGPDLRLIGFMGETKLVHARVKDIDLMSSSVVLEELASNTD